MVLVTPLQNNLTTLIYSLVNGLYKVNTESTKLILDAEQFGVSSNLIVSTLVYRKCHFLLSFSYASLLRHSMDSTEMPLSIFQPRIHHKLASITRCRLLYLQYKFWFKW